MRRWKPGRWGDAVEPHHADGDRHSGIQRHYYRPVALRHHRGLRSERYADRLGGSIQRNLYLIRHYAQRRLGVHYDSGWIAGHGLAINQ